MTNQEVMQSALDALGAYMSATDSEEDEKAHSLMAKSFFELKEALAKQEQGEPVALEPAPKNSLPTFKECRRIITNHEFRERAKAGLEGQVLDTPRTTPIPTALHHFIHEYDDADPYRSAWFLHRLDCVLKEASTPQQRTWVGLTDEEMRQVCYEIFSYDPYAIARVIEAKLKEKNT